MLFTCRCTTASTRQSWSGRSAHGSLAAERKPLPGFSWCAARQVLGGLLAGVAAIAAPRADAIEIIDGTKLRQSGFDIIYNARDLDKSQVRDGVPEVAAEDRGP